MEIKKKTRRLVFLFVSLAAILLVVSYFTIGTARAQENVEYQLVWQDNFNGNKIDTSRWSVIPRYPWQPFWFMSSNKSLFDVRNGRLRLYCRRNKNLEPKDTAKFICGGIWTKGKYNIKYGKVEIRARVCGVQGSWPALWTIIDKPVEYGSKEYAEIDLMESINRDKTAHQTIHNYSVDIAKKIPFNDYHVEVPISYRKYNIYSAEILPDKIIMGVNGKSTLVYPRKKGMDGQFPYGVGQEIIIDMQYGGTKWVGKTNIKELPAYMDVDWVKVYELKDRK